MKVYYLVACLVLVPLVLAQDDLLSVELQKGSYVPYETVQVEIVTRNPVRDVTVNDLGVYDSSGSKMWVSPFFQKIDENVYAVYFDLPGSLVPGVYTMRVDRVPFLVNNVLEERTVSQSFTVASSAVVVSVSPGFFVITPGVKSVVLGVKSHGSDVTLTFNHSRLFSSQYSTPQQVLDGVQRSFTFQVGDVNASSKGVLSVWYEGVSVDVPVWVNVPQKPVPALSFETREPRLERSIEEDEVVKGPLRVKNNLNVSLEGVLVEVLGTLREIVVVEPSLLSLSPLGVVDVSVTMNQDKSPARMEYEGVVRVRRGVTDVIEFPMKITILPSQGEPSRVEVNDTREEDLFSEPLVEGEESSTDEQVEELLNINFEEQPVVEKQGSLGLIFLIVFFLILSVLFFLLSRKPRVKKQELF